MYLYGEGLPESTRRAYGSSGRGVLSNSLLACGSYGRCVKFQPRYCLRDNLPIVLSIIPEQFHNVLDPSGARFLVTVDDDISWTESKQLFEFIHSSLCDNHGYNHPIHHVVPVRKISLAQSHGPGTKNFNGFKERGGGPGKITCQFACRVHEFACLHASLVPTALPPANDKS